MRMPATLLMLICLTTCGSETRIEGDYVGSWLLANRSGILVSPLGRTVLTFQGNGQWIQDFVSLEFSGSGAGTYTVRGDTLTTTSVERVVSRYTYKADSDSLSLDELNRPNPGRLAYVRVNGRSAVFSSVP
jgi:hypothetical protein